MACEIRKNEKEREREKIWKKEGVIEGIVMKRRGEKKIKKNTSIPRKIERDMKREETNVQLRASEMECLTRVNTKNTRSLEK